MFGSESNRQHSAEVWHSVWWRLHWYWNN